MIHFCDVVKAMENYIHEKFTDDLLIIHRINWDNDLGSGLALYEIKKKKIKVTFENKTDNFEILISSTNTNSDNSYINLFFGSQNELKKTGFNTLIENLIQ